MNERMKNAIIIVLSILIIIALININNLKKESNKGLEENTSKTSTSENGGEVIEADEVEQKYDLANSKVSDYEYDLVLSRLTTEEENAYQTMKKSIKHIEDAQERQQKSKQLKEMYKKYRDKYITNSEQKKINEYESKLEKITEKYKKYDKLKWDIKQNGNTTQKQKEIETLKTEILKDIDKLGDI